MSLQDGTYYEYKDEEETPRGVHYEKTQDEDINASTIGRYAETKDFKHGLSKLEMQ